jgi:hypothetical protein
MQAFAFVIGGFDFSRGGYYSMRDGSGVADIRANIAASFPDVVFTANSSLTNSYLESLDLVVLLSATGFGGSVNTGISPLSAAEKTALISFVRNGGNAMIFTDNDFASASFNASNSLANPFGVHSTGLIGGNGIEATVTDTNNPVTNGPFGLIASYTTDYPGWFDSLGVNAVSLARLPNGKSTLAFIDRNILSATSGAVVLSSDGNIIFAGSNGPRRQLIDNAIAFFEHKSDIPEPATLALLGIGILGLLGYSRREIKGSSCKVG